MCLQKPKAVETRETESLEGTCKASVQKKVRTWKKPIGKPKRPLSAYNIYFQLERDRIVNGEVEKVFSRADVDKVRILPLELMPKRRDRKTHGKVGFGDLARMIGSKWKKLSDEEKIAFNERAKLEKMRYRRDVEEWVQRTNDVKDFNEDEIKVDTSHDMKDATTECMAFGGKLERIFLGVNSSGTEGSQNFPGTTTYGNNDIQLTNGRDLSANMRDFLMEKQYVSDLDEATMGGRINTGSCPMYTKRAYDRAMAVFGDVENTLGFGANRNRSLVGNPVSIPTAYPIVHKRLPVPSQKNMQSTNYTFRPMSLSQVASFQAPEYQNVVKGRWLTGHPLRDGDNYRRGRKMQLQNLHPFLSDREVDSNNHLNRSSISTGVVDMNENHESSYHHPTGSTSFDPDSIPKNYYSMLGCEYGKALQDEFEDDYYDASESIHTSSQHNLGNFYEN